MDRKSLKQQNQTQFFQQPSNVNEEYGYDCILYHLFIQWRMFQLTVLVLSTLSLYFCYIYSEISLNEILFKTNFNNVTMQAISVRMTYFIRTALYSEHKSWSQRVSIQTGLTVTLYIHILCGFRGHSFVFNLSKLSLSDLT